MRKTYRRYRSRQRKEINKFRVGIGGFLFALVFALIPMLVNGELSGYNITNITEQMESTMRTITASTVEAKTSTSWSLEDIPEYSGSPYIELNGNIPEFDSSDFTTESFETYSDFDSLGRCGAAFANVGYDLMPTENREDTSSVYPTGWLQNNKYDSIDGEWIYNRCLLLAYELTAENANEKNFITGTRYFNVNGMLPFENMIADYVRETHNHVLYRVTPIFESDNLLAYGVQMEAESVEDGGKGVMFNVFCYNVQPGFTINYATGVNNEQN